MLSKLRSKCFRWGRPLIEKGSWTLVPFSVCWQAASFLRNFLYDAQWLSSKRAPKTVVSIGNLVAGGTGKTPLVHLIASQFPHRQVAILSRGYGEVPDEPLLLKRRLPHAKIYVGKNRGKLAEKAAQEGAELLLLDDGFQHRKLQRDFDLVVLRGDDLWGKGHFLPRGYLRESPKNLKRVDQIFISNGESPSLPYPYISLKTVPTRILTLDEQEIPSIQGVEAALYSGIGNPASFRKTVASLGAKIVFEWVLADHEKATVKELQDFSIRAKKLGAKVLLTTEKDFVKLPRPLQLDLPLYFIEIALQVEGGKDLWEKLIAKIDQEIDNAFRHDKEYKN